MNVAARKANAAARKVFTAGVVVLSTSAIAIAPSVQPPSPSAQQVARTTPAVLLTAQVSPLAQPLDPISFAIAWAERVVIPPSASAPFPTPQLLPIVAPSSVGGTIKDVYNAVEPWVRYGFDLAAYAVGWLPYVGWLAPQITIFYNFGERIARSITYNLADVLDGHVTIVQGLINVGVDTFNSFVQLGIDELHFFLPSLPPLPPFPFSAVQTPSTSVPALTVPAPLVGKPTTAAKPVTPAGADTRHAKDPTVRGNTPHGTVTHPAHGPGDVGNATSDVHPTADTASAVPKSTPDGTKHDAPGATSVGHDGRTVANTHSGKKN